MDSGNATETIDTAVKLIPKGVSLLHVKLLNLICELTISLPTFDSGVVGERVPRRVIVRNRKLCERIHSTQVAMPSIFAG